MEPSRSTRAMRGTTWVLDNPCDKLPLSKEVHKVRGCPAVSPTTLHHQSPRASAKSSIIEALSDDRSGRSGPTPGS